MVNVTVKFNNRDYILSCEDGQEQELEKLSKSYNANFIKAIDLIQKCKGKIICVGMGKSGHIIRKISATLSSVGVPSIYLHPSEAAHGDLGACNPKQDCFLIMSYSGNTDELKSEAKQLFEQAGKIQLVGKMIARIS